MVIARLLCIAGALFAPASSWADPPKNADFLKLSEAQRRWWYVGAYTALGHAALLESEEKGKCVWAWYFDAQEKKEALLEKSFALYPDHTPSSVVIAMLRRDCGAFKVSSAGK